MTEPHSDGFRPAGESVLITGCSSGIGRQTALALAGRGFTVFATVRREADADSLRGLNMPGLVPVCPVDLADQEDASQTAAFVAHELARRGKEGLYALVNNAGAGRRTASPFMRGAPEMGERHGGVRRKADGRRQSRRGRRTGPHGQKAQAAILGGSHGESRRLPGIPAAARRRLDFEKALLTPGWPLGKRKIINGRWRGPGPGERMGPW
jgi:hypothetical protein